MKKITPMMAQWHACKEKAPNALLLFRMGDFYEAFYKDAVDIAGCLDLTLTKRQDIEMCGVPAQSLDGYLGKLVAQGYTVAIAEQLENPKDVKGLVKRDIVRVVSPGTVVESGLLDEKSHSYIAAIAKNGSIYGIAYMDLSCGEFKASEWEALNDLERELAYLQPKELLKDHKVKKIETEAIEHLYPLPTLLEATEILKEHYGLLTLDGLGLNQKTAAVIASAALLSHLKHHHQFHVQAKVQLINAKDTMGIDPITCVNLELVEAKHGGKTLFDFLDRTKTGMGARLLKNFIQKPLQAVPEIEKRQTCISLLHKNYASVSKIQHHLGGIKDLERLIVKVGLGYASPKDLFALGVSLSHIAPLKELSLHLAPLTPMIEQLDPLQSIQEKITRWLSSPPPARVSDGQVIQKGVHQALDEYRDIARNSKDYLQKYQEEIKTKTGIKNLKVGFNRMFGYYLEVSRGQAHLVPDDFERRQTLVNQERFVTPTLKTFEQKVLAAEEMIHKLEKELFFELVQDVLPYQDKIQEMAKTLAHLDALVSLAIVAKECLFTKPVVDTSHILNIEGGRHPVIEALFEQTFVPNNTTMDDKTRMFIITGPNMAGKSTYIRQVALIVILAQMGSYVPASFAHIGVVDKVFSRIGASDDITRGQSTFMVEMAETANILNHATDRSLVILDEIGRGTSTYDGISIAWSVAEFLLTVKGKQAKTLFATHYWELTKLENEIEGVTNYHAHVKEEGNGIRFTRKMVPGGTDRSYGIHVAELAGIPKQVTQRAYDILKHLEETSNRKSLFQAPKRKKRVNKDQLLLFS